VIQELSGSGSALLDVFPGLPECRKGFVYANDKPGLGVDLNEAEAAKYPAVAGVTTWTQTRLMDGSLALP
jgi:mannonate dehydratase